MLLAEERKQSIEDNYSREIFTTSAPQKKSSVPSKIVLKFADHQYFIEDLFFLYICTLPTVLPTTVGPVNVYKIAKRQIL